MPAVNLIQGFKHISLGRPPKKSGNALLRTPGYGGDGPTFKIISGALQTKRGPLKAYELGYAHICFEVDDIAGTVKKILAHGGAVSSTFEDIDGAVAVYTMDPEGNIVELHFPFSSPLTPSTIYRSLNSLIRIYFKLEPPKNNDIRFLHVNINSKDWKKTSAFYQKAFGAIPTGFDRKYEGKFIGELTGVKGAVVKGQHVALPGYSDGGPTFEIFTYNKQTSRGPLGLEDIGNVAVGFEVKNIATALKSVLDAGGEFVSRIGDESAIIKDKDGNHIHLKQK